jgi:hypothetical protein
MAGLIAFDRSHGADVEPVSALARPADAPGRIPQGRLCSSAPRRSNDHTLSGDSRDTKFPRRGRDLLPGKPVADPERAGCWARRVEPRAASMTPDPAVRSSRRRFMKNWGAIRDGVSGAVLIVGSAFRGYHIAR